MNFLLLGRLSKYVFFISKTLARKHFMLEHELIYELSNCHFCRVQSMVEMVKNTNTCTSLLGESDLRNSLQQAYFCRYFHGYKNIFIVLDKCGVNGHFAWQLFWLLGELEK